VLESNSTSEPTPSGKGEIEFGSRLLDSYLPPILGKLRCTAQLVSICCLQEE